MAGTEYPNVTGSARPEPAAVTGERLRYTVEYAYEHSPFYRDHLTEAGIEPADIRTAEDLSRIPPVDSADVLANQPPEADEFRFRVPDADTRRPFKTSGTSGPPKTVFHSYDEMARIYDGVKRGHEHFGFTEDTVAVDYFPYVGLNISNFGTEGGLARIGCETIPVANTQYPPATEVELLRQHAPRGAGRYAVMGLASHIDAKGMRFRDAGYDPRELGIDLVVLAGESVSPARKTHIGELFGAEVYEYIGSTEGGAFAFECVEGPGFHVLEDAVHVEVVDPGTGEPVAAGEAGALVITPLLAPGEESAMPLIRYRLGDLVRVHDAPATCDCPLGAFKRIHHLGREGSEFDLSGVNLTPMYFEDQLYRIPELRGRVRDFQVRLSYDAATGRDVCEFLVACDGVAGEETVDVSPTAEPQSAADELGHRLLANNPHLRSSVAYFDAVRLDVKLVDALETGPGKPQRVIRE